MINVVVFVQLVPLTMDSSGKLGETAQKWANPPYDVYIQFWFFDVKNKDDIQQRGAKPNVEQKGPYGFR
jgi:hypothetical protein